MKLIDGMTDVRVLAASSALWAWVILLAVGVNCSDARADSFNELVGVWDVDLDFVTSTYERGDGWPTPFGRSSYQIYITVKENHLCIKKLGVAMHKDGNLIFKDVDLTVKDADYSNGRLQILTEYTVDDSYGLEYHKEKYDLQIDADRKEVASGIWVDEREHRGGGFGSMKFTKRSHAELTRRSDKPSVPKNERSMSIDRNPPVSAEESPSDTGGRNVRQSQQVDEQIKALDRKIADQEEKNRSYEKMNAESPGAATSMLLQSGQSLLESYKQQREMLEKKQ